MRISDWSSDVCSSDLIYLADTGIAEHDGPLRAWTQDDARFSGGEASMDWNFADNGSGLWNLRLFGDVVRAELSGSGTRQLDLSVPHGDHGHDYSVELARGGNLPRIRSEEHTSELQSLMRHTYAVFCLKKKNIHRQTEKT